MRNRYVFLLLLVLACLAQATSSVRADSPQQRVFTVSMTYPEKNYRNRLVNAAAGFDQLQHFFDTVQWKPNFSYSFLRDVLHNSLKADAGFVMTEEGYGYGLCGASSLLNRFVQTATFQDGSGKEQPLFQAVLVWTWNGDPTYGKYGATVYLDNTGTKKNKDYVWILNPAYHGLAPQMMVHFTLEDRTVKLTGTYSDSVATPTKIPSTATPTKVPATKAPTKTPAKVSATKAPTKTAIPTATPTKTASIDYSRFTPEQKSTLLTQRLSKIIGERKFGVIIVPVGDSANDMSEAGFNQDVQLYVASAFKGPVAIYFFENVSDQVWRNVPIQYWNVKDASKIPAKYQDAWTQYHAILYDVYQMTVYSQNESTGDVLQYVYDNTPQNQNGDNAIVAFNNWSQQSVGVSADSGLYLWWAGKTNVKGLQDNRYGSRKFYYGGKWLLPTNTYSARDLAKYYVHLATQGHDLGYYDMATELLSTLAEGEQSMIEYFAHKQGIQEASKDGFVGPTSDYSDGYYISTDAGLLTLPSGAQYAVAFMTFDSGDLLAFTISTVNTYLLNYSPPKTVGNEAGR